MRLAPAILMLAVIIAGSVVLVRSHGTSRVGLDMIIFALAVNTITAVTRLRRRHA